MSPLVFIHTPGGSGVNLLQDQALALVAKMLADEQVTPSPTLWETREPGIDPECGSAESPDYDPPELHTTLREAVESAMPFWEGSGATFEQVAYLALVSGLVLSTGVGVDDEDNAAADDGDGTSGQDRESYTDDQDHENYVTDEGAEDE